MTLKRSADGSRLDKKQREKNQTALALNNTITSRGEKTSDDRERSITMIAQKKGPTKARGKCLSTTVVGTLVFTECESLNSEKPGGGGRRDRE